MGKKNKTNGISKPQYDWKSNDENTNVELVVENVRLAFSNNGKALFEAEEYQGKHNFKADLILDDEAVNQVKEAIAHLVICNVDDDFEVSDLGSEFDEDGEIEGLKHVALRVGNLNISKKSEDGSPYDGFEGNLYIKSKRPEDQGAPAVFADTEEEITEFPDARIYKDGCYANVAVRLYYSEKWEMIGAVIEAVIYTDEGEPFTVDQSYSVNEQKKKKLIGSHKPKESKAKKAFGKKKKKKNKSED